MSGRTALLAALLAAGCCRLDPFCVAPEAILQYLSVPAAGARIVAGQGMAWQGHDLWLAFSSDAAVKPPSKQALAPIECTEARAWFAEQLAAQKQPAPPARLECQGAKDASKDYSNGVWLLFDPATRTYYYRSWSHS